MTKQELEKYLFSNLKGFNSDRELKSVVKYYLECNGVGKRNYDKDIEALNSGVPIQYVCNTSFFYGNEFYVDSNVLIPRPETEELVYWVYQDYKWDKEKSLLDIGSGSGCILISLLNCLQDWKGFAVDISDKALQVVEENASRYGKPIQKFNWDILNQSPPISLNDIDVIVSNPPYILKSEKYRMDDSVLRYEPELALFVEGDDALVFYYKIIELLVSSTNKEAVAYMETSDLYHEELTDYLKKNKLRFEFKKDLQDKWRMLKVYNG